MIIGDIGRKCAWIFFRNSSKAIDPNSVQTFMFEEPNLVDFEVGPDGWLYR